MKYKLFIILLLLLSVCSVYSQNTSGPLERILVDGKWGFINTAGTVVVAPDFDYAFPYKNGFTVVGKEIDGQLKRAYLNSKGQLITDFVFDRAYYFFGDLARVKIGKLWGYINKEGELVADCVYSWVSDFDNGIGVVEKDGVVGVILKDGTLKEFPYYPSIRFYNGIGKFYIDKLYGLIDTDGSVLSAAMFDSVNIGQDTIIVKYNGKYGTVDREGHTIIAPIYDGLYESNTAGILIFKQNNKYGLLKVTGETVLALGDNRIVDVYNKLMTVYRDRKYSFKRIDNLEVDYVELDAVYQENVNGKIVFRVRKNGLFGLLDENSRWLTEAKYEYIGSFQENLAVVSEKGLYGYIDSEGREVIEPQFAAAYGFSEGLAVVREGSSETGLRGYINLKGEFEIDPQFNWAYSFKDGIAHIAYGDFNTGTFGYINKKGEIISPARN